MKVKLIENSTGTKKYKDLTVGNTYVSVLLVSVLALPSCTPEGNEGESICGNGVLEVDEQCDGDDLGGQDCLSASGEQTGRLKCTTLCQFDVSECHTCGNGITEFGETCDGDCPTECNDGSSCTRDFVLGSPDLCDVYCGREIIRDCVSDDGCCAIGCDLSNDSDCTYACVDNGNCTQEFCEQAFIPAGTYTRGTSDHEYPPFCEDLLIGECGDKNPAHQVQLDAFCIDVYEVTGERYADCVEAGICTPGGSEWTPSKRSEEVLVNHYPSPCGDDVELCPHYPVNNKNYEQASTYCQWLGRRLCTEAEWERAANGPGPIKRRFPWEENTYVCDDEPPCLYANIGEEDLDLVNSYPYGVSVEGVYNLIGNVYEWVSDYYGPYDPPDDGLMINPIGPESGTHRIIRGGCMLFGPKITISDRTVVDPKFDWG